MIGLIASEWLKIRSVRSTPYLLVGGGVILLALTVLATAAAVSFWDDASASVRANVGPVGAGIDEGILLAPLIFGTFGALAMTGEYATRSIRTSLVAVPQRPAFLLAKAAVVLGLGLLAGLVTVFAMYGTAQAIVADRPIGAPLHLALSDLFPWIGALTVVALLGLGIGTVLRSTAGSIVTVVGLVYVLPQVANLLAEPWASRLVSVSVIGLRSQLTGGVDDAMFTPLVAALLLAAWAVIPLLLAGAVLHRRDA
ncbi:MAG: ABC transporter permease [Streptosporangiales bacterium]|nr:ABC transporter permease [Streptosporangiales bacterium]